MKHFRHRSLLTIVAPLVVLGLLWLTDPDGGAATQIWLIRVITALVAVGLTHWVRKAYFDYPEADLRSLFKTASITSTGAGLALIAVAIFLLGVLMLFAGQVRAQDIKSYIPPQAAPLVKLLGSEQRAAWPDHPEPAMLAALIEHESGCFALRTKCWNPGSSLKSTREEGAGLGQITRAYRPDGSVRFDAMAEMRERHPALREWSWENVYRRPDLQLRAVVLKTRDDFQTFRAVPDPRERLIFTDVAYNRGAGGVQSERRVCASVAGCDPGRWFGHVERHCTASRAPIYGTRSPCDISRHHPVDVLARAPKYRGLV